MSIEKFTEYKSSLFGEVYRHQGFLTSVSNVLNSCDDTKKQQVSSLVSEYQMNINKSLGLLYALYRTVNLLGEKEEQISQIMGEDLANAFIMNNSEIVGDFADTSVNVTSNAEFTQGDDVQVTEQHDSTQEIVVEDVPNVTEGNSVQVDGGDISGVGPIVADDNQNIVESDNSTNSFVLSPMEEGIANENLNISDHEIFTTNNQIAPAPVADSQIAPAPVADNQIAPAPVADSQIAPAPVADSQIAPAPVADSQIAPAPVADSQIAPAPVADSQIAPAPVADMASTTETVKVTQDVNNVSSPKQYVRTGNGQVKAILVTSSQIGKLSGSKATQKDLLSSEVQNAVSMGAQAQVQQLMNQASQAYAAGNVEEAQKYMNQASELNRTLQPEQSSQTDGGVTFVKK